MVFVHGLILLFLSFSLQAKPCKTITRTLLDLYPDHTHEIMVTRFENASNKHKFLRSFIPFYYQEVKKSSSELPAFLKAGKTTGHVVGDAHVENFGYVVSNNGKSVFALNDFDDVAQAPLVLDVMRLSQSASYLDKELDHAKLIKNYVAGLNEAPYEFSNYVKKLAAKSQEGGHLTKAEFTETKTGKIFAIKQEPNFVVSSAQNKQLSDLVKKKFGPKTKLMDSYRTMKESGGSAYGQRYHLLTEIDGEVHFIELKEVQDSGIVPSLLSKKTSNAERILSARDVFLGKDFGQKLDVVNFEKKNFQLRFKSEGNKSIDFGKVKPVDMHEVIKDEFYLLGQLHRKSLGSNSAKIKSYVQDLNSVSAEEWEATLKVMRKKIKAAFDKANE